MVLMCKANGVSYITENIFKGRFIHVMELQRLGAKITIKVAVHESKGILILLVQK